jgi:hypothetical protein
MFYLMRRWQRHKITSGLVVDIFSENKKNIAPQITAVISKTPSFVAKFSMHEAFCCCLCVISRVTVHCATGPSPSSVDGKKWTHSKTLRKVWFNAPRLLPVGLEEEHRSGQMALLFFRKEGGLEENGRETKYNFMSLWAECRKSHNVRIGNKCFENVANFGQRGEKILKNYNYRLEEAKSRLGNGNYSSVQNLLSSHLPHYK